MKSKSWMTWESESLRRYASVSRRVRRFGIAGGTFAVSDDDATRDQLAESLRQGLSRIAAVAECGGENAELFSDGAPLSFTWRAGGLFGGLLFHGPHDGFGSGGAPTFAVTLCPTYGWQIHT